MMPAGKVDEKNKNNISRRRFVLNSGLLLGSLVPFTNDSFFTGTPSDKKKLIEKLLGNISTLPNFCTHEHWGSIESIGQAPEQNGFRCDTTAGAKPLRATSVWDLFLDPYEEGWLIAGQKDPHAAAKEAGYSDFIAWWKNTPAKALKSLESLAQSSLMTGGFQCTRRGIEWQYNIDLEKFNLTDWQKVDAAINANYTDPFAWYKKAMKTANFTELIRPVHPEFYVTEESATSKKDELSFTHTVMRVDPFMDLWKNDSPRRNALAKIAGIDPADAKSWKLFINKIFDIAAAGNTLGIKQLQAYRRTLDYQPRKDSDVKFRGELSANEITAFQDWVMHECCKQAHERKWIHQVHVGTHNLSGSNPLPLQQLAKQYPDMQIVMIHCWPFLKEAAFLAKLIPNIHVDTCWLPVLNPEFLKEAFHTWLNYVPSHKIMLGHDSTHIEMATGSSLFTREILTESLVAQQKKLKMSETSIIETAADMLQNNAVRLYKIGKLTK
jgi:predicted TIM-barrel fold metal-dependent hydrolase